MSRKCNNKYFVTIDIAIKPSASEIGWIKSGIIVGIMALDGVQIECATSILGPMLVTKTVDDNLNIFLWCIITQSKDE